MAMNKNKQLITTLIVFLSTSELILYRYQKQKTLFLTDLNIAY